MNINDLYTLESHETGSEMQVRDENGKKLDAFITICGVDSKVYRKAKNEMRREIVKDLNADYEDLRAKTLADITISWRNFTDGKKKIKFNKKKIEQIYLNAPYVMDQIDLFLHNRLNFTKG